MVKLSDKEIKIILKYYKMGISIEIISIATLIPKDEIERIIHDNL